MIENSGEKDLMIEWKSLPEDDYEVSAVLVKIVITRFLR